MQPGNKEYRYLGLLIREQPMLPVKVKNAIDMHPNKEWLMSHISKEYDNHSILRKERLISQPKKLESLDQTRSRRDGNVARQRIQELLSF